ncbi:MAG: transporter substrate-binding domain-containing protein [Desulfosarcina sp.]|nr:transporter substrate-binding domain-containing protein [Desulfobacterales bacterium]
MTPSRHLRLFAFVCVCLLLFAMAPGCQAPAPQVQPQPPEAPLTMGVLRVGISTNKQPLIYRQDGQIVGLEAEFAKGLAQYLGRRLEFVELKWKDQIPYLLDRKTDIIMAGMSITDLRRVRIAFCVPYAKTGQMALVRREDIGRFTSGYYSLVEIPRIGAVRDTTGDHFIRSRFPDTRKFFYDTLADGVRALIRRKVDVLINDAPAVMLAEAKYESWLAQMPTLFTSEYLAWGVRKDNPELIREANGYIAELKKNGQLQQMVGHCIPFAEQ